MLFDILSQEIDTKLVEQYRGIESVLKKSLKLLRYIARGNDVVQMRLFERLDSLLEIRVVEADLAVALKEVSNISIVRRNHANITSNSLAKPFHYRFTEVAYFIL